MKKTKSNLLSIVVLAFFVFLATGSTSTESDENEEKTNTSSINSSNKNNNDTSNTTNKATPQEEAEKGIKKSIKPENLKSVTYSADTKTIKVEYNPHSKVGDTSYAMIDEASFVRGIYENLVITGRKVFKINSVDNLNIIAYMDTLDNYGKTTEVRGAEISFSKEEFNKFDWDSLKLTNVYKQIESSATTYFVDSSLMKAINPGKDLFLYFSD